MNKSEFLERLRQELCGLPQADVEERLAFYSEMIDDRVEDGCSEEEAVVAVGSVPEITARIVAEIPLTKIAGEQIKGKRRLKTWEIVLLAVGSPIWFSLVVAAVAVAVSLYAALWSVIVTAWAVFVALIGISLGGVLVFVRSLLEDTLLSGIAVLAVGVVCAGLSIFGFYGCKAATKGVLLLTKKIVLGVKLCFVKKGGS